MTRIAAPAAQTAPALIDTSLWIEALRRDGPQEARHCVFDALDTGTALMNGLIRTELLRGIRGQEFARLSELLDAVVMVPLVRSTWDTAAQLGAYLQTQGLTVPTPDLIVAASAIEQEATLFHCDHHYQMISRAPGVEKALGSTLRQKAVGDLPG